MWTQVEVRTLLLEISLKAGNDGERAIAELRYWSRKLCTK